MKIGMLGTGIVGQTLATKLVALGHDVCMGARDASNEKALAWVKASGAHASSDTFATTAAFGEIVFNCTNGVGTMDALTSAGADNLRGKVLVDVSNPLDFSQGMPPCNFTGPRESLGELVQNEFPEARVVKALNMMNCMVMVDPGRVAGGDHDTFIAGNDAAAKAQVETLLRDGFGWKSVLDLDDISGSRGMEAYVLFWVRLWGTLQTGDFNVKVMR